MAISKLAKNRLGFLLLGMSNNTAFVIMIAAAYDLLKQSEQPQPQLQAFSSQQTPTTAFLAAQPSNGTQEKYCNEQSTSTILLANTLPSLFIKIIYSFCLLRVPASYKMFATAGLTAIAFLMTGLFQTKLPIFLGVISGSFSSGLGECTILSSTPLYGDVSLSGWAMGTGAAGLVGAGAYAILRLYFTTRTIMLIMLSTPVSMLLAFFFIVEPLSEEERRQDSGIEGNSAPQAAACDNPSDNNQLAKSPFASGNTRNYGSRDQLETDCTIQGGQHGRKLDLRTKIHIFPSLLKFFIPLFLVYFAEYFINQGLFELIYYPNIYIGSRLFDHATQYSFYQVCYQTGVVISRSTIELFRIKNIWVMSLLQCFNALLFLLHTAKLIHIPSFYLVVALITYEGFLGGFTYVNGFYRIKQEVREEWKEFSMSTVAIADSIGIALAGFTAIPVHDALCKLYT